MSEALNSTTDHGRAAVLVARVLVPDHVVHREFPTETVVLNLETGKYHGLNPVAGRMLDRLAGGATPAEVAATIAAEYGQPTAEVQDDVVALCRDLHQRGLISLDSGAGR